MKIFLTIVLVFGVCIVGGLDEAQAQIENTYGRAVWQGLMGQ